MRIDHVKTSIMSHAPILNFTARKVFYEGATRLFLGISDGCVLASGLFCTWPRVSRPGNY